MKMMFRVLVFVVFLMALAAFLFATGWCVGGVCKIGTEYILG